jgi:hypothetical protein
MARRVAKAIYYATPHNKPYEQLAAPHVREWEKRAELAIIAMREPTEAMERAGLREVTIDATWFKPAWQAGVDAALS